MKKYIIVILFAVLLINAFSDEESVVNIGLLPFENDETGIIVLNFSQYLSSLMGASTGDPLFTRVRSLRMFKKEPHELNNNELFELAKISGFDYMVWGKVIGEGEVVILELKILDMAEKRIRTFPISVWDDIPDLIEMERVFSSQTGESGTASKLQLPDPDDKRSKRTVKSGFLGGFNFGVRSSVYADIAAGGSASAFADTGVHTMIDLSIKHGDAFVSEFLITEDKKRSSNYVMLKKLTYKGKMGIVGFTLGDNFENYSQLSFSRNMRGITTKTEFSFMDLNVFSGLSDLGFDNTRFPLFSSGLMTNKAFGNMLRLGLGMVFSQEVDWGLVEKPNNLSKGSEFITFINAGGNYGMLNYQSNFALSQSRNSTQDGYLPGAAFILETRYSKNSYIVRLLLARYSKDFTTRTAMPVKDRQDHYLTFNWSVRSGFDVYFNTRYMFNSLDNSENRIWEVTPAVGLSMNTRNIGSYFARFQIAHRDNKDGSKIANRTNIELGSSQVFIGIPVNLSLTYSGNRESSTGYDLYTLFVNVAKSVSLLGKDINLTLGNSSIFSKNFGSPDSTNNSTFLSSSTSFGILNVNLNCGYDHANSAGNLNGLFRWGLNTGVKFEKIGRLFFEINGENTTDRNTPANNSSVSRVLLGWENDF